MAWTTPSKLELANPDEIGWHPVESLLFPVSKELGFPTSRLQTQIPIRVDLFGRLRVPSLYNQRSRKSCHFTFSLFLQ